MQTQSGAVGAILIIDTDTGEGPPGNVYFRDSAAYDRLTVTGYVTERCVHAHVTLSTHESGVGGHLEEGTEVRTFAIVTIAELTDIEAADIDSYQSA